MPPSQVRNSVLYIPVQCVVGYGTGYTAQPHRSVVIPSAAWRWAPKRWHETGHAQRRFETRSGLGETAINAVPPLQNKQQQPPPPPPPLQQQASKQQSQQICTTPYYAARVRVSVCPPPDGECVEACACKHVS